MYVISGNWDDGYSRGGVRTVNYINKLFLTGK